MGSSNLNYNNLIDRFRSIYGARDISLARAPGRINLIGEHTDYNGCPVLPMAINRDILAAFRPLDEGVVELRNTDEAFSPRSFSVQENIPPYPSGDWGNYPKAAVQGLVDYYTEKFDKFPSFRGFQAVIEGNIPPAAGMSSSSALVVLTALIFLACNTISMDRRELANLLAKAERYVGTQGGGMDQAISLMGKANHALKIDFFPLRVEPVRLPRGIVFVVANSTVIAGKTEGAMMSYNQRAVECRLATALIQSCMSRDLDRDIPIQLIGNMTEETVGISTDEIWKRTESYLHEKPYSLAEVTDTLDLSTGEIERRYCLMSNGSTLPEPEEGYQLKRRFRHIYTEWQRVEQCLAALRTGDIARFGTYMNQSHASCRDDYEISCPEIDRLTELAGENGAIGSRLTGAGFGGCTVSLLEERRVPGFIERIIRVFYRDFLKLHLNTYDELIFSTEAVDGASIENT